MTADLKTRVIGDSSSYERAIDRAATATDRYRDSLTSLEIELMKVEKQLEDDMAEAMRKQEEAGEHLGRGMLAAGAAIATGLGLAVKEAIEWESAWAGVQKTTEGTPEQMAQLEAELRRLATTLPATHQEIAAVAEAAGQLGVKRQDVAAFTKVMIDMGVSTNLTAEEAATSMARFANIMGTPIDEVDRLGSAIVALGNDGASTEAEIIDMGLRIAGAGRLIGLTEADVLALANAMSSLGIRAEAGGTAISQVMTLIDDSVHQGGDALEGFAELAGMTADQFARTWRTDPPQAILALVGGLRNVEQQGGSTSLTLEKLGITGIRQLDTLRRLSGGYDILKNSLKTGEQAWADNNALVNEANRRYETTESKLKVARNQLTEFAITLGEVLLPALAGLAETATAVLAVFSSLPGPVRTGIVVLASLAATIGLVGGAALVAAPHIRRTREALATLGGVGGVARRSLGGVASMLGGPWGIALTAGVLALGYFANKHAQSTSRIQEHVDALDQETGALTDSNRAIVLRTLEQQGAIEAAERLGISARDLTLAALGEEDALRRVNSALSSATGEATDFDSALASGVTSINQQKGDVTLLSGVIRGHNKEVTEAAERQKRYAEVTGDAAGETEKATEFTAEYGAITAETADEVADLEQKVRDLRDSLNLLNGVALDAEEAAIAFREQIRKMKADVDENGTSLRANTRAGDANRQMLLDRIQAAEKDAQATFDHTAKTRGHEAAVRAADRTMRRNINTLLDEADQLGLNRRQTERYIARILGVPVKSITKYTAPGLLAALAQARDLDKTADGLHGRNVVTTFTQRHRVEYLGVQRRQGFQKQPAAGGLVGDYNPIIPFQSGGMVHGPGGPRDDAAGLFALSNGEFVVNAAATRANLSLLKAINSGSIDAGRLVRGNRGGGVTVENLNLRAYSDRFSLRQVEDELAFHGAA